MRQKPMIFISFGHFSFDKGDDLEEEISDSCSDCEQDDEEVEDEEDECDENDEDDDDDDDEEDEDEEDCSSGGEITDESDIIQQNTRLEALLEAAGKNLLELVGKLCNSIRLSR